MVWTRVIAAVATTAIAATVVSVTGVITCSASVAEDT